MDYILYLNGDEGFITLKTVANNNNITLIVLPSGYDNNRIISFAERKNITVQFRDKETTIKLEQPKSILISSAFPYKIYKKEIQSIKLAVNFHAAILPQYRGRHGNTWAMMNDEKTLGVTVHEIDDKFDNGKILAIQTFEVNDSLSLLDIQNNLEESLVTLLKTFINGKKPLKLTKEIGTNTYWRPRTENDSNINWRMDNRQIFLFVRALNRSPIYAYSKYTKNIFHFINVQISTKKISAIAGSVHIINDNIYIATGNNTSIKVIEYTTNRNQLHNHMVLH